MSPEKFGSWTMEAVSYNVGMNGIERRSNEQNSNNYYDLRLLQKLLGTFSD